MTIPAMGALTLTELAMKMIKCYFMRRSEEVTIKIPLVPVR
jgi:hypothetical protein